MNAIRSTIRKSAVLSGMACVGIALAMPSHAHWGPSSAAAVYGTSKVCSHTDAGGANARSARVTLKVDAYWVGWEGGAGYYDYQEFVTLKNTSSAGKIADITGVYYSPYMDPWDWSGIKVFNDVNSGSSRTYGGWWNLTNGQVGFTNAKCQVRNS